METRPPTSANDTPAGAAARRRHSSIVVGVSLGLLLLVAAGAWLAWSLARQVPDAAPRPGSIGARPFPGGGAGAGTAGAPAVSGDSAASDSTVR